MQTSLHAVCDSPGPTASPVCAAHLTLIMLVADAEHDSRAQETADAAVSADAAASADAAEGMFSISLWLCIFCNSEAEREPNQPGLQPTVPSTALRRFKAFCVYLLILFKLMTMSGLPVQAKRLLLTPWHLSWLHPWRPPATPLRTACTRQRQSSHRSPKHLLPPLPWSKQLPGSCCGPTERTGFEEHFIGRRWATSQRRGTGIELFNYLLVDGGADQRSKLGALGQEKFLSCVDRQSFFCWLHCARAYCVEITLHFMAATGRMNVSCHVRVPAIHFLSAGPALRPLAAAGLDQTPKNI